MLQVCEEYKSELDMITTTLKEPTCPLSSRAVEAQQQRLKALSKRAELVRTLIQEHWLKINGSARSVVSHSDLANSFQFFDAELLTEVAESFRARLLEVYLEERVKPPPRGPPRTVHATRKCTAGAPNELSFEIGQIISNGMLSA